MAVCMEMDNSSTDLRRSRYKSHPFSTSPKSCCSECNIQIFGSYILSLLSSFLVAAGFYLAMLKWDYLWLILSITGSFLIFIGACMYCSGQQALRRHTKYHHHSNSRRRRNKDRGSDHLMSSNLSESRSVSQLSINMIPQYFSNSEITGNPVTVNHPTPLPYTQILRINGQSFLILPISNDTNPPQIDNTIALQSLMIKVPSSDGVTNQANETGSGDLLLQASKMDSLLISNEKAAKLSEAQSTNCALSQTQKPTTTDNITKKTITTNNNESRSSHIPVPSTSSTGATRHNSQLNSSQTSTSTGTRRLLRRDTFSKSRPDCPNVCDATVNSAHLNKFNSQQSAISRNTASSLNRATHNQQTAGDLLQSNSSLPHRQSSSSAISSSNDANSNNFNTSLNSDSDNPPPSSVNCSERTTNSQQATAEETFFGDSSAVFDENLIDTNNFTPPPSYNEVLSVETVSGQPSSS